MLWIYIYTTFIYDWLLERVNRAEQPPMICCWANSFCHSEMDKLIMRWVPKEVSGGRLKSIGQQKKMKSPLNRSHETNRIHIQMCCHRVIDWLSAGRTLEVAEEHTRFSSTLEEIIINWDTLILSACVINPGHNILIDRHQRPQRYCPTSR